MTKKVINDPAILKKYKQFKELETEYVNGLNKIKARFSIAKQNDVTATLDNLNQSLQTVEEYAKAKKPVLKKLQEELKILIENRKIK